MGTDTIEHTTIEHTTIEHDTGRSARSDDRRIGSANDGGTVRIALRIVAAVVGAVLGAVAGFAISILLWLVFVEGGPEVPIGALLSIVVLAVPTGVIAGGVIGWQLGRNSKA